MREYGQTTISRARGYANGKKIVSLRMKEATPGWGTIYAEVQGTANRPYNSKIQFYTRNGRLVLAPDYCNCPVAFDCKHLAAVMLFLGKRAAEYELTAKGLVSSGLDWETEDWLEKMGKAAVANSAPDKAAKPYNKILAYCIEKHSYGDKVILTLRTGSVKKSGEIKLENSYATADLSRPPKYMAEEDFPLVSRYRRMQSDRYDYQGCQPTGSEGGKLLQDILATGRLFVLKENSSHYDIESERIEEPGPGETVKATWEQLGSGKMRPSLEYLA